MVDNKSDAIIGKELHPQAKKLVKQFINNFTESLIVQAKVLAFRRGAELVLSNDVQEALEIITKERTKNWKKQIVIILGSALLGAFVQGFVTELSGGNTVLMAVYTVLGFIGMFLVFWGLRL
jgi:hypothetical protein